MRAVWAFAALTLLPACFLTPASARQTDLQGDFDGDGRRDTAAFEESEDGNLVLVVHLAAAPETPAVIWSGDVSSAPYFSASTTGPGTYRTMCHLYDGCGSTVPPQVTLTHDAVVVHALEGPADFLYYWDGSAFQNIIVGE
jgi:hypothetical protein